MIWVKMPEESKIDREDVGKLQNQGRSVRTQIGKRYGSVEAMMREGQIVGRSNCSGKMSNGPSVRSYNLERPEWRGLRK